jgi:hypothetical protein
MLLRAAVLLAAFIHASASMAFACWWGPQAPGHLVRSAEVIVRVRAIDAVTQPGSSPFELLPKTVVRFLILEQLKGETRLFDLSVSGTLTAHPDFNDQSVPYPTVRLGGRDGGCVARTYQQGGEFLLFLKTQNGALTPYWAELSATNEQIRGADDPWVLWVRQELDAASRK